MKTQLFWIMTFAGFAGAQTQSVVGTWQGTLDAGALKMRLAFHIAANENGSLTSTLDSLDQNVCGIPVQQTTVTANKLHLEMPGMRAQFDGVLSENGTQIAGTFTQGVA